MTDAAPAASVPSGGRAGQGAAVALWAGTLAAYAAAAVWLASHPPALSSDDAMFFAHGLERFSILDFSPQFPGYPGFIAMGRLLLPFAGNPVRALGWLTTALALALPPLAAVIARRNLEVTWAPPFAFLLTLSMPLLPDLALSLLSDGAGIAFLLVFLALLPAPGDRVRYWPALLAGAALAWAGCCRPSDAALLAGAAAGAMIAAPSLLIPAATGGVLVAGPTLALMFVLEPLYLSEGLRFTEGHALIWGNTPFAAGAHPDNWLSVILAQPGLPALALIFVVAAIVVLPRLRHTRPARASASLAFLAHAVWIALFQNPDSLRHLAPLAVLGSVLLVLWLGERLRLAAAALAVALPLQLYVDLATVDPKAGEPPAMRVEAWLRHQPAGTVLATNADVFLLRQHLVGMRIYDMHYPADVRLGLLIAKGPAYRLTTTQLPGMMAAATFSSRFLGEDTLWLYAIDA